MSDNVDLPIGTVARETRKALGLTQANMAERLDLSVEFYARIERGHALPSIEVFLRMVDALGVSADALLGLDAARVAPGAPPLTSPADPPELREVADRLRQARPGIVRVVSLLLTELERAHAAERDRSRSQGIRKPSPASSRDDESTP